MTLLDIGCGWGATMMRALHRHDVKVVGLTLSKNQALHVQNLIDSDDAPRSQRSARRLGEVRRAGGPHRVDRRVRNFGRDRYGQFFTRAMLLHIIVRPSDEDYAQRKLPITMRHMRFAKFIMQEIFPGGHLPQAKAAEQGAR